MQRMLMILGARISNVSDCDGVNDLIDACEGTPSGLTVNSVGCADLDGDGVFANVDICDSPARWTIDVMVVLSSKSQFNGPPALL